ncbi:hypothetical protein DES36_11068 [Alkalibaculum bacchi]|uniref:Uncharacterized protein n=1 Tax=Alkalibaculum bacchi TaxID=645887 RepID=A0A366I5I2_9FIRM|nr:hypothetical protein DES36_11068 [Alkalibaculum bacchi]
MVMLSHVNIKNNIVVLTYYNTRLLGRAGYAM